MFSALRLTTASLLRLFKSNEFVAAALACIRKNSKHIVCSVRFIHTRSLYHNNNNKIEELNLPCCGALQKIWHSLVMVDFCERGENPPRHEKARNNNNCINIWEQQQHHQIITTLCLGAKSMYLQCQQCLQKLAARVSWLAVTQNTRSVHARQWGNNGDAKSNDISTIFKMLRSAADISHFLLLFDQSICPRQRTWKF